MTCHSTPAAVARSLASAWPPVAVGHSEPTWPSSGWDLAVKAQVTAWTVPQEFGGLGAAPSAVLEGCLELARGSLSIAFILSQFQAAVTRIVGSSNSAAKSRWLPPLARGAAFATVGISHLTTSRQHTGRPAVEAVPVGAGFELTGEAPWVTGATVADVLVVGAVLPDGWQLLFAVPAQAAGVNVGSPVSLLALSESCTAPVCFDRVRVGAGDCLAGPADQVLKQTSGSGAGSLTTSALALGHALESIDRLRTHREQREDLQPVFTALEKEGADLREALLSTAQDSGPFQWTAEALRAATTSLALRSAQAYLAASKGAGYVVGHPAERLVREAMFFLVWSCPQQVASRLLTEFSRCDSV